MPGDDKCAASGPLNFSPDSYPLLCQVQQKGGVKHLDLSQLEQLAAELRRSLIAVVQHTGGHLASNLGAVELTIALHYVFNSPTDAFLWDVGHQAYAHKMLTGRWQDFASLRQRTGLSGFPRRDESEHDHLNAGHAGTAISAGLGLDLGRSLNPDYIRKREQGRTATRPKVLSVVGDASLTSGMAFEAMNHCGHQANRLVVVLNDNEMSISPNVGAISRILSRLTAGHSYVFLRDHFNQLIRRIPILGLRAYRSLLWLKGIIKKAVYRTNLFTEFGFKYIGPIDGHNIKMLIDTFERIALLAEPVFLHVRTQKGKGLKEAEEAPDKYHGISPGASPIEADGAGKVSGAARATFTECFSASLVDLYATYDELVCISAAMTSSTGLHRFARLQPQRFFDVGIAEQHALTLASGLAMAGKLPLVAIYSTFMQRALDQLIHDISLMRIPAILVCDRAGIVPGDGDTHQGIYDIVQFRSILGLELYSPGTQEQVRTCLAAALEAKSQEILAQQQRCQAGDHDFCSSPIVIRLPKRNCPDGGSFPGSNPRRHEVGDAAVGVYCFPAKEMATALLLCTGSLLPEAWELQRRIPSLEVVQLYRLAPLPQLDAYIEAAAPCAIFCIEDGVLAGGIGEAVLRQLMALQLRRRQFIPFFLRGVQEKVPQLGDYPQLLQDYGLDPNSLEHWLREAMAGL